jgi:hypothetical protein
LRKSVFPDIENDAIKEKYADAPPEEHTVPRIAPVTEQTEDDGSSLNQYSAVLYEVNLKDEQLKK